MKRKDGGEGFGGAKIECWNCSPLSLSDAIWPNEFHDSHREQDKHANNVTTHERMSPCRAQGLDRRVGQGGEGSQEKEKAKDERTGDRKQRREEREI